MKEFRIEDPQCKCSGRARQIESPTSFDWLAFRAPLVTLVTCCNLSSIYGTVNNLSRSFRLLKEDYQSQSLSGDYREARLRVRQDSR